MSNLIRGLSENGGVVFCGVDSTAIVRKADQCDLQRRPWPSADGGCPDGLHAQG